MNCIPLLFYTVNKFISDGKLLLDENNVQEIFQHNI